MENQNQQTQNPTAEPVQPVNQAPAKTNNSLVVLLSVLLLISVAIAGFFALQTQKLVKQLAQLQTSVSPSPSPAATPDETANLSRDEVLRDWKTYTDENFKVQFKYPSNWKDEVINSKSNAGFNYTQITLAKIEYFDPIPKGKPLIMITVSNTINQDLLSVYQNTKITGSTKVDNIPAEVRQHNSTSVDSKYITFTKGEQSFEIESRLHTQSVEQELILDQILSTFKFLEATPSATPQ